MLRARCSPRFALQQCVVAAMAFREIDALPEVVWSSGNAQYPNMTLKRIAMGSCSKQWLPQPLWSHVADLRPDLWLWLGDGAYALADTADAQRQALLSAKANKNYSAFLDTGILVDGTWDDHDLGVNDGGDDIYMPERQEAFLNFLQVGAADARWTRPGVYTSLEFGMGPQKVKVIVLDTRTFRRRPPYLYVARNAMPWPLINVLGRLLGSITRLVLPGEDDDLLGSTQWAWLDHELNISTASVHVLISSIQILTPNPIFESWGHWPRARARLQNILRQRSPPGFVMVSGDVHFAEIRGPELTTSGLTHTCAGTWHGSPWRYTICSIAIALFQPLSPFPASSYQGINFATIDIDWHQRLLRLTVRDASGSPVLENSLGFGAASVTAVWTINIKGMLLSIAITMVLVATTKQVPRFCSAMARGRGGGVQIEQVLVRTSGGSCKRVPRINVATCDFQDAQVRKDVGWYLEQCGLVLIRGVWTQEAMLAMSHALGGLEQARSGEEGQNSFISVLGPRTGKPDPCTSGNGFTRDALPLHTDRSCAQTPPDLVVTAVHRKSHSGGATLLADALDVVPQLDAATKRALCDTQFCFKFGSGKHMFPLLEPYRKGNWAVRYRMDEQIEMLTAEAQTAYAAFSKALGLATVRIDLEPGDGYIIDNHRWLHGREAFQGDRELWRTLVCTTFVQLGFSFM